MSASRTIRNGTATRFTRRVLLATVASLVLAAAACSGEAGVEQTAADGSGALDEPAQPDDRPTPTPTKRALSWDGEVITYTEDDPRALGDLVAQDPDTGDVRKLVDTDSIDSEFFGRLIGSAGWSADGRWVAFEVVACRGGGPDKAGTGGLWVTNGLDEPRQLTRPCFEDANVAPYNELWAWSPAGAQLVVAHKSIDGDALVLIEPETGDRTDLGKAAGRVTTLTWSPDGNRITYGAVGGGGRFIRWAWVVASISSLRARSE